MNDRHIKKLKTIITREPSSLRTFVVRYAFENADDPVAFFHNLERFSEGEAIMSFLANTKSCKKFFDDYYQEIEGTLEDMWAAGEFPDFIPHGDLRCWLAEAAFIYTARQIATELNANPRPQLFTDRQYAQLVANGIEAQLSEGYVRKPVVKLFTPDGAATWLLGDIYPDDPDVAFGLCDLGVGKPELGNVSLTELSALRGTLGLPVERDLQFTPRKPLPEYANDARHAGRITV